MTAEFHTTKDFPRDLCNEISALEPCNPFHTLGFADAMQALGAQPRLLYTADQGLLLKGCLGFLRSGRLNRSLEIPSVPGFTSDDIFWTSLVNLCRQERVTQLGVDSFASASAVIPSLPGEVSRQSRIEYILDLGSPDLWSKMSTNHRRNIQKALKAGVVIGRSSAAQACQDHARLQDASMERRIGRGEHVMADAQIRTAAALLEHQVGELFRATLGNQVLSSILVLRAVRGAYYHSAGTSREGMSLGASHLLIKTVVEILRDEGIQRFNLGGADARNPGLERFKTGFGGQAVSLEAARFYFGNRLQKGLAAMVDLLRRFAQPQAAVKAKPNASVQNQAQQS
jgi:hypothetical protein